MTKWKRIDNNNTQQATMSNGRMFRVAKHYNENCEHNGEWQVLEYNDDSGDWEWCNTYSPMWYAKDQAVILATYS